MIKTYLTDGTLINNTTIEQLQNSIAIRQTYLPPRVSSTKSDPVKKIEIKLREDVIPNIEIHDYEGLELFEDKEILSMEEKLELERIKKTTNDDLEKYE